MLKYFMLLISLFGLSYSDAISCTQSNSIASNIQVSLTPSNPTIGSNYVLDTTYTLSEDVYDGNAIYYVTLSGFPIVNEKDDLCKSLENGPTPCPLKKGVISSSINGTVPNDAPHGKYNSKITWNNEDNKEILCIEFDFDL